MLRELVEKKHTVYAPNVKDWQDAIRLACSPFVKDGTVDPEYAEDVIRCVQKYGPYIVLFPGVAMPHSQEGGPLVHGTGISFMRLRERVSFDPDDPDKWADLFFAIAADDPAVHLENIKSLMEALQNDQLLERLRGVDNDEDLLALAEEFGV